MKKSIQFLILFLFTLIGFSCTNQNSEALDTKNILIEKIINTSEKTMLNGKEKVVIMLSDYCEEINCKEYFKDYKESILLYNKEDIFMRGLRKHTIIKEIDNKNTSVKIIKGRFLKRGEKYIPEVIQIRI